MQVKRISLTVITIVLTLVGVQQTVVLYERHLVRFYGKPPPLTPPNPIAFQHKIDLWRDSQGKVETNSRYLAGVPGAYIDGPNGEHIWDTNNYWQGAWKGSTDGWGVKLAFYKKNTPDAMALVEIGRIAIISGDDADYLFTPDGKFAKFELTASDGAVIPPKEGKSLGKDYPQQISVGVYPRWPNGIIKALDFGIVTNGSPDSVGNYKLNDVFSITNEGDYMLTVRPVIYKDKDDVSEDKDVAGTNLFDRIDLPSVSAKIHLMPSN